MTGRGEQRLGIGGLDNDAEIHHGDAVGDVFYDGKIVRDENVGEPEPVLQIAQQVQDLRADRHIQRRHRLVADDEFRFHRERAGNGDALALAAGEFVGIATRKARLEPDQAQQFLDPFTAACGRNQVVQAQGLGQDLAHGHARIERGIGILKDDLRVAAEGAQLVRVQGQEIAALEANVAGIRLDQPQHQPAHGGFAAAGLADQRQRLAGIDAEADAVDRPDERGRPPEHRPAGDEMFHQTLDLEQGGHAAHPALGRLLRALIASNFAAPFLLPSPRVAQRGGGEGSGVGGGAAYTEAAVPAEAPPTPALSAPTLPTARKSSRGEGEETRSAMLVLHRAEGTNCITITTPASPAAP